MKNLILTTIAISGLFAGLVLASAQQAPLHTTNSVHQATNSVHSVNKPGKAKGNKHSAHPGTPHQTGTNQPAAAVSK